MKLFSFPYVWGKNKQRLKKEVKTCQLFRHIFLCFCLVFKMMKRNIFDDEKQYKNCMYMERREESEKFIIEMDKIKIIWKKIKNIFGIRFATIFEAFPGNKKQFLSATTFYFSAWSISLGFVQNLRWLLLCWMDCREALACLHLLWQLCFRLLTCSRRPHPPCLRY